jgi:hypothetical protein
MKDSRLCALGFGALLALILTVPLSIVALTDTGVARASTAPAPPVSQTPGATPSVAPGDTAGTLAVVAVVAGLLIVVGIGVKMFDLKRKREAEAVQLQAQLADALLREGGLTITPTAHIPLWAGGPVTVELSGPAPSSPEGREAALQLVEREAARIRPDVRVIDRIQRAA